MRNVVAKHLHLFGNRIYKKFDVVCPTIYPDIKIVVDFRDGISDSIFNHGYYHKNLTSYVMKNIGNNFFSIDVGANIGWFTCLLAKKASDGKVWSFECNPSVFKRCKTNICLNNINNVFLSDKAVGNVSGEQSFVCYSHSGHGHLGDSVRFKDTYVGFSKVDVVRLDDYLKDISRLDFLKIDVEGFEFDVIKGGKNLIKKFKPVIVFEFDGQQRCLNFLEKLDYDFFLLDNVGNNIAIGKDGRQLKNLDNVICIHKEKK